MTLTWPALGAKLEQHTVAVTGGRLAGFLVRDIRSRAEMGYVWQAGAVWRWRAPDSASHGERSTQRAAVEVLRDIRDLDLKASGCAQQSSLPMLDVEDEDMRDLDARVDARRVESDVRVVTPPAQKPAPRRIVWGDEASAVPDLTAAIAHAFKRHHGAM